MTWVARVAVLLERGSASLATKAASIAQHSRGTDLDRRDCRERRAQGSSPTKVRHTLVRRCTTLG